MFSAFFFFFFFLVSSLEVIAYSIQVFFVNLKKKKRKLRCSSVVLCRSPPVVMALLIKLHIRDPPLSFFFSHFLSGLCSECCAEFCFSQSCVNCIMR